PVSAAAPPSGGRTETAQERAGQPREPQPAEPGEDGERDGGCGDTGDGDLERVHGAAPATWPSPVATGRRTACRAGAPRGRPGPDGPRARESLMVFPLGTRSSGTALSRRTRLPPGRPERPPAPGSGC